MFILCLISEHQSTSPEVSVGKGPNILSLKAPVFVLFCLTLLSSTGLHLSLRNPCLRRPVCARAALQGPCSTECGNPWKEASIQVLKVTSSNDSAWNALLKKALCFLFCSSFPLFSSSSHYIQLQHGQPVAQPDLLPHLCSLPEL